MVLISKACSTPHSRNCPSEEAFCAAKVMSSKSSGAMSGPSLPLPKQCSRPATVVTHVNFPLAATAANGPTPGDGLHWPCLFKPKL